MIVVDTRADLTLDAFGRVAWEGEGVTLATGVAERMDAAHASFRALVAARLAEDPGALLYGVTTAPGDGAATPLSPDALARRPRGLWTGASFGDPLPERVVRGIAFARLADLVGGHAASRGHVGVAVAAMLGGEPLPTVPAQGNGGAGEVLALGHLFADLADELELEPKEAMALINGSPSAAALVADVALAGRGRVDLAERTLALSAEALRAPLEAYADDLEALWGDEHEAGALRALRALLAGGAPARQDHQAPVSHRILPRVLGRTREAQAHAERVAAASLASVTGNPTYVPPDPQRPLGAFLSNGGFHNARAYPAIDGSALAWADLCQLAQRHVDKLFLHPATAPLVAAEEWTAKPLHMVAAGFAEEARATAQPTLLGLGGFGQNDVPSPTFAAWGKAQGVGRALDRALAVLAALASQALHADGRPAPPALAGFLEEVRAAFPPVDAPRRLGPGVARLAEAFSARVL
ncbi:MAG: aromatic amino acid lyase, partial [Actinomycetota bacterium]|nr:aromatic amino acid lyase [Actinomycetota bacterium]